MRIPVLTGALLLGGCSDYGFNSGKDAYPDSGWDSADPGSDEGDSDDTDDSDDGDEPVGRVLTILLTLSDEFMDQSVASTLLLNSVAWATPDGVTSPRVLVIRDDDHSGEDMDDSTNAWQTLVDAGYDADFLDEPGSGIEASALEGYHVAMLSNPGHSPDDVSTVEALYDFSCAGQGIIFQGDDMAHFDDESAFDMESLTRLVYQDNGTEYHGYQIDNDDGDAYQVQLANGGSTILRGIEGAVFSYGNDIDTTEAATGDIDILATATVAGTGLPTKPVIAAWSL